MHRREAHEGKCTARCNRDALEMIPVMPGTPQRGGWSERAALCCRRTLPVAYTHVLRVTVYNCCIARYRDGRGLARMHAFYTRMRSRVGRAV